MTAERTCSVEFCDRAPESLGLCHPHYLQQREGKPFKPIRHRSPKGVHKKPRVDPLNKAIREWAAANGIEVPAKGMIPSHVKEQYHNRDA